MGFFSFKQDGGGGDTGKKVSKKKTKKRHHAKKHRQNEMETKPKIGRPKRPTVTPPPQKVYIRAGGQQSGVDSSAPRKIQTDSKEPLPQRPPPQLRQHKPQPQMPPFQPAPVDPPVVIPEENRMTFREYLAGVRRHPTSPNRPPPNLQPQQQLPAAAPSSQQPKPLSKPASIPVKPDADNGNAQNKSKNESEKKVKKASPDLGQSGKAQPKSTEKIPETAESPKQDGKEQQQQSDNAKNSKQRECDRMKTFVQTFIKKDTEDMDAMFDKLRGYIPKSFTRLLFDENQDKCRFADIICMDQSRIVLEDCAEGGFIHANWIPMNRDNFNDRFIISQFPTSTTVFDFWHMIWQENITTIINIMTEAEWKEFGEPIGMLPETGKCRHVADGYAVTFQKELMAPNGEYKVVSYGIIHENEYRQILWLSYLGWQEGKIPKDTEAMLQVMSLLKTQRRPIVVMSVAGAGRAGTYVSLEYAHSILHALKPKKISISDCIQKVRDHRLHAVQTIHQFKFIYCVLIDHVLAVKKIRNDIDDEMMTKYDKFKQEVFSSAFVEEKPMPSVI